MCFNVHRMGRADWRPYMDALQVLFHATHVHCHHSRSRRRRRPARLLCVLNGQMRHHHPWQRLHWFCVYLCSIESLFHLCLNTIGKSSQEFDGHTLLFTLHIQILHWYTYWYTRAWILEFLFYKSMCKLEEDLRTFL